MSFGPFIKASAIALSLGLGASAAHANLISNGDFESGLTGWSVFDQADGDGTWYSSSVGSATPESGQSTSAVGGSGLYAVSDQNGPGAHSLIQSFTVGAGAIVNVSFDMFVNSYADYAEARGGLDYTLIPNQHARVDILTAGATPFSTASGDIVATLVAPFADLVVDSTPNPFTAYSFDVSAELAAGGTFQLRFAEVDNQLFLNMGVDNVVVQARTDEGTGVPAPTPLALLAMGLLALGSRKR